MYPANRFTSRPPFLGFLAGSLLAALLATPTLAQYDHFDQAALADLVNNQIGTIDSVSTDVSYRYYVVEDTTKLWARHVVYRKIGGRQNRELVQLLNRTAHIDYLNVGDTLIFPNRFDLDLRAYAPFPRFYEGAQNLDKLFIIDKTLQAFAAYEHGKLRRWGVVNTGGAGTETPSGRFNFNWRSEYRVSSMSPPGDPWEMYWVFNFHHERGIHTHQYYMPTCSASSHGCVRMMNADARWLYDWADGWTRQGDRIVEQGTMVLVTGTEETKLPGFFFFSPEAPLLRQAVLPEDPWSVPPGTDQQRMFDRLRAQNQKAEASRGDTR